MMTAPCPGACPPRRSRVLPARVLPAFVFLALVGLVLPLGWPGPARAQVFEPETFTLDNGLQVVVLPDHRAPVVHQMVWYKVGAADEPPGKSGIAHLLEHLMFKGTKTLPAGRFSEIVAAHGGRDNAFTSSDYTAYYQTISRDNLEMVMEMEADRMANLSLDPEDVKTELQVVREERRSRTDNEPRALLGERMDQALWVTHPYKNPVIGWEGELAALTLDDAIDFYRHWYGPNNAVLIVAGDITAEELRPLAERIYGPVPRVDVPKRERVGTLPPPLDATLVMRHAQVTQPTFTRQLIAPSYARDPDGQAYALQVLDEILGGGATSRLYRSLVVDQAIAVSAGSYYRASALDWGVFGFYGSPRDGVETEALVAAVEAEIARLLSDGVTDEEVANAKHRLTAGLVYARDSLSDGAQAIGTAVTTGSTPADVEAWPDRIRAVTAEDVMTAARTLLGGHTASVTGILLPEPRS